MTINEIIMDRIYNKLKKHGNVHFNEYRPTADSVREFYIDAKLIDNVYFEVVANDVDNKISISLKFHHELATRAIFNYEPARPTFHPEEVIKNIIGMYESVKSSFHKFHKYEKLVTKSCGLEPIHGRT